MPINTTGILKVNSIKDKEITPKTKNEKVPDVFGEIVIQKLVGKGSCMFGK